MCHNGVVHRWVLYVYIVKILFIIYVLTPHFILFRIMIYLFLYFICNILSYTYMNIYLVHTLSNNIIHHLSSIIFVLGVLACIIVALLPRSLFILHYLLFILYSSDVSHKSSTTNVCITVQTIPLPVLKTFTCTTYASTYYLFVPATVWSFIILSIIDDHRPLIHLLFLHSITYLTQISTCP